MAATGAPNSDVEAAETVAPPRRGRRRLVNFLLVLSSILAFLSVFSVWVERQALNTDDWVSTSGQFLQNDTIRTAVGNYLVDQLYAHVNVKKEVRKVLPSAVHQLAGPASAGLRQVAGTASDEILKTSTAQSLWQTANRDAHEQLLAVLAGGNANVSTTGGVVTLNLGSLVNSLVSQIGVGPNIQLPADAGQVTILHSNQLGTAQDIANGIRGSAVILVLLTLAMLSLAIYLSRGERWITVLYAGIALLAAGFAVIVARHVVGQIIVNQLVTNDSVKSAANDAWGIATSLMISIATSVIVAGLLFIVAGWLASPTTLAWRVRRAMAPVLQRWTGWVYGALGLILGLYFLTAATQGLRQFLTTLAIGGMVAFGIDGLRRQTVTEFPQAKQSDVFERARDRAMEFASEGAKTIGERARRIRVPERLQQHQSGEGGYDPPTERMAESGGGSAPAAAPAPAVAPQETRISKLERLAALHEKGVLSDEELAAEKARVLAGED